MGPLLADTFVSGWTFNPSRTHGLGLVIKAISSAEQNLAVGPSGAAKFPGALLAALTFMALQVIEMIALNYFIGIQKQRFGANRVNSQNERCEGNEVSHTAFLLNVGEVDQEGRIVRCEKAMAGLVRVLQI
jgi:hypothetical protein